LSGPAGARDDGAAGGGIRRGAGGERTGLVFLNLGGPTTLDAVEPFLFNLFSDPDILDIPLPPVVRRTVARLIARFRSPGVREAYAKIGDGSPLYRYSRAQADAVGRKLEEEAGEPGRFPTYLAMRYWHPLTGETVDDLLKDGIGKIVLVSLYPHYSMATTGSSMNEWQRVCALKGARFEATLIERWAEYPPYLACLADRVEKGLKEFREVPPSEVTILVSAHGLPQKVIDAGDPYLDEIRATVAGMEKLLRARGIGSPVHLCFQSRVGPVKWLKPYTVDEIPRLARRGTRGMLVVPVSFVSDHFETLFEIDLLYGDLARKAGVREFRRIDSLNDAPDFIETLASLARPLVGLDAKAAAGAAQGAGPSADARTGAPS
jgi:ferrochelatase